MKTKKTARITRHVLLGDLDLPFEAEVTINLNYVFEYEPSCGGGWDLTYSGWDMLLDEDGMVVINNLGDTYNELASYVEKNIDDDWALEAMEVAR